VIEKALRMVDHAIGAPRFRIAAVKIAIRYGHCFHAGSATCFDVAAVVANVDAVCRRDRE
jgi:hypothetical protein